MQTNSMDKQTANKTPVNRINYDAYIEEPWEVIGSYLMVSIWTNWFVIR